jgi:hypothetical protein
LADGWKFTSSLRAGDEERSRALHYIGTPKKRRQIRDMIRMDVTDQHRIEITNVRTSAGKIDGCPGTHIDE